MPKPLSQDLRTRIVAHVTAGNSRQNAARKFAVSPSCVVNLISRWQQDGTCSPRTIGRPKGSGKLADYRTFLLGAVRQQPDITMPELAEVLLERHGISVTPSGLSRFFCREGYTYKKNFGRHGARST